MSRWLVAFNAFVAVALFSTSPLKATAHGLQVETITAWNEYIRGIDSVMKARVEGRRSFLWTDESEDRRQRVRNGEIVVAAVIADGIRKVPDGLIHHWIGATFIPGATIDTLSSVMEGYSAYKDFYKPVVVDSKILNCTPADQTFWMLWQHKVLFVTAAMEGKYQAKHIRLDARRGYNIADSIELREIENYGGAAQRLLPEGTGSGYIWRIHSVARYEQRDGGVNLELEAVALTRDIPVSVRWLVKPIVNRLSINSLRTTLQQTRDVTASVLPRSDIASLCWN